MAREKGEIKNQRRILDASYNSVRTVSSIYDDKILVRTSSGQIGTRINNIYDILEELKEKLPLACKKHLLDYSSNSTIIDNLVIKNLSNSHLFGFLLPDDIKGYAPKLNGNPENFEYQIASSYYDFFVEPLVESNFTPKTIDMANLYGLEIKIKNILNSKCMTENISEFIDLFHEYIKICDKNNIPSYWLRGDSSLGINPDLTGERFNEEIFRKVYSSIGKKKTILTNKITNEYELLFYWIVDKLNIENKMISLIKVRVNHYINSEMTKEDLAEFNYLYGKKIKFSKEKIKKGIGDAIENVKLTISNIYQNEYHTIFYNIASKLNLPEGIPINEAINYVINYIDSHFLEFQLKYLNKKYNMNVPYNIENIKENIRKIPDQIIGNKYIPRNEYLNKEALEATKFFRNIDRFNEDVFKHYRLNCNLNISKSDKLLMLSNYDLPMLFDQILKKFNYRMTKGSGLCLIKPERDARGILREKEIKIGINLLKCKDKVNSFFKLPQTTDCLGYFSLLKIKMPYIDRFNIIKSSEEFWKLVTSTKIPMAHTLMFGEYEFDKTLLYFDSEEPYKIGNRYIKLTDKNLGNFYHGELMRHGEFNCFSMINNVQINMDENGNYKDCLYFSGNARCMIGVREKNKKQSIWFQVENQKLLKDKTFFLKKLSNGELEFDFAFLEKQAILNYSKNGLDTMTYLNNSLSDDMINLNSMSFFKKIERLKNDKYLVYSHRISQLKRLKLFIQGELNYYSNDRENERRNSCFNINEIFGLNFNDKEKEFILRVIKGEVDKQLNYISSLYNLEKYSINANGDFNSKFFIQLTNLYKTLVYGDMYDCGTIDNITDNLIDFYDKLDYHSDISSLFEHNLPPMAYPIIVDKLCNLYHIDDVNPEIVSLKQFIDFVKRIKSKINPGITIVR